MVGDDHDCCQLELAWWLSSLWMAVGLWMVAGNCAKAIMCNGIACDGWLLRSSKSVQQWDGAVKAKVYNGAVKQPKVYDDAVEAKVYDGARQCKWKFRMVHGGESKSVGQCGESKSVRRWKWRCTPVKQWCMTMKKWQGKAKVQDKVHDGEGDGAWDCKSNSAWDGEWDSAWDGNDFTAAIDNTTKEILHLK